MKQRTISRPFSLTGAGIHSGKSSLLSVSPSSPNSGIYFIKGGKKTPALADYVQGTRRGTALAGIAVVEHFLSAAYALGIDNLQLKIDGDEIPSLDGSALPFVEAFSRAGIADQNEYKNFFILDTPIKIIEGDSSLEVLPFHGFKIDFMVNFLGFGEQRRAFDLENDDYAREIAPARTFGYIEEYALLKQQGLACGATADNALVLSQDGYVNRPRFPDEPVRHKILDLIGDLALLGRPLKADIRAVRSGHKLNLELVRRLFDHVKA